MRLFLLNQPLFEPLHHHFLSFLVSLLILRHLVGVLLRGRFIVALRHLVLFLIRVKALLEVLLQLRNEVVLDLVLEARFRLIRIRGLLHFECGLNFTVIEIRKSESGIFKLVNIFNN